MSDKPGHGKNEPAPFFYTWSAQADAVSVAITGGRGAWFETADAGRFLDLGSLIYQVNAGHGERRIIEAVKAQADRLCVSIPGAVYPEKTALAKKLIELAGPEFGRVFFTLGGSDANENALKIARLYTGRYKVISRHRSYHGATMGAVSLSGDWRRAAVEPGLSGVVHVPDWEHLAWRRDDAPLSLIPATIEHEGIRKVAAVFVEPVVGANGVLIPPAGYMRELREACDRTGTLLVVDEVLTGFGRTGRWFAYQHFDGVVPDMITMGKAITGGYGTLGAVVVQERIAKHFDTEVLAAGLTHYGHPLAVASALAAIEVYERDGLVGRAASLEPVLYEELERIRARVPRVRVNRVIGLLSATELDAEPSAYRRLKAALHQRKIHAHVLPRSGALVLAPPLCIEEGELRQGLTAVGDALEEALS